MQVGQKVYVLPNLKPGHIDGVYPKYTDIFRIRMDDGTTVHSARSGITLDPNDILKELLK